MAEKAYIGMGMEGAIARWYEKNAAKDMEEFRHLAGRIAGSVPAGSAILEVAPGPGFLAVELAKRGFAVTGLDISNTFVRLASENARTAGVRVAFERGNASAMPFADRSFDFLVCRAAFKNFADPLGALSEMHRVLRPGGQALIIDLRRDVTMADISRYVDALGVSSLNRLLIKLTFRTMLLPRAWTVSAMRELLGRTPFHHADIRPNAIGMEIRLDA